MFFKQKPDKHIEEDEDLETLVLRLETSSYTEDKIDTLQLLYEFSRKDPISTGTYSLNAILDSIKDLDDIHYSIQILLTVFRSIHSLEFTDLFLKRDENIEILVENSSKDPEKVYEILSIMAENDRFKERLLLCKNISYYLVSGLDENRYEVLQKVIPVSEQFRKQLLFEGIFEKIESKLEARYSEWCMLLIEMLLEDKHFNQNYFIETAWTVILNYIDTRATDVFRLLNCLVDNTNGNIQYIKKNVYKFVSFDLAIKKKQYNFIYSMIYNDLFFLKEFIGIYNKYTFKEITNSFLKQYAKDVNVEKLDVKDIENLGVETENNVVQDNINKTYLIIYYILNNETISFNENQNSALLLISEVLIYSNSFGQYPVNINTASEINSLLYKNITKDLSLFYKLLLILTVRDIPTENCIRENINIDINTVLFILFSFDTSRVEPISQSILEVINDDSKDALSKDALSKDEHLKWFCILLCLMHNIRLNFNNACCLKYLRKIRNLLSSPDIKKEMFLLDDCINILLDKVNELVLKYSERCTKEDLLNYTLK
ncbi:hypothetical protein NGRA_1356 [Nosema granulosis]|uniref:Vesicular transport protein n=1 Tax=Nosema granulosis TaxID=83296 RepID=A0A9P6GZL6_9MICR|nr:hypothetical protein NGRA_1356 [Nosema granulosis]